MSTARPYIFCRARSSVVMARTGISNTHACFNLISRSMASRLMNHMASHRRVETLRRIRRLQTISAEILISSNWRVRVPRMKEREREREKAWLSDRWSCWRRGVEYNIRFNYWLVRTRDFHPAFIYGNWCSSCCCCNWSPWWDDADWGHEDIRTAMTVYILISNTPYIVI